MPGSFQSFYIVNIFLLSFVLNALARKVLGVSDSNICDHEVVCPCDFPPSAFYLFIVFVQMALCSMYGCFIFIVLRKRYLPSWFSGL